MRIRAKTIAVAIVERAITIWGAIQKSSHEPTYKIDTKMKQRDKERQFLLSQSLKTNN